MVGPSGEGSSISKMQFLALRSTPTTSWEPLWDFSRWFRMHNICDQNIEQLWDLEVLLKRLYKNYLLYKNVNKCLHLCRQFGQLWGYCKIQMRDGTWTKATEAQLERKKHQGSGSNQTRQMCLWRWERELEHHPSQGMTVGKWCPDGTVRLEERWRAQHRICCV